MRKTNRFLTLLYFNIAYIACTTIQSSALSFTNKINNILVLDHLNINHERGRHDWLRAFYFDFLKCVVDPRKKENIELGRKTLWANIGANQFHLPEGKPEAQVLKGLVTLSYPTLSGLRDRMEECASKLEGSKFQVVEDLNNSLHVTDPWGTHFRLVHGDPLERDPRGQQPGEGVSEGLGIRDLTLYCPQGTNMTGIARFYQEILGAVTEITQSNVCTVSVGPQQTLTFKEHPNPNTDVKHHEMLDESSDFPEAKPAFLSNYGPHVSIYVRSLPATYKAADKLNLVYVNPRFKRQAFTLKDAVDQCMFRIIDIVDPESPNTVILKLEHEVRSVVKKDGTVYKSCPFNGIPKEPERLNV